METLRQWAMSICFAAVAGGITMLLLPQSNSLSKMLRMAVSLFFLCSVVCPLTTVADTLSFHSQQVQQEEISKRAEEIEKNTTQFAYLLAEGNINKLIQETLTALGVEPSKIMVYLEEADGKILNVRAEIYGEAALQSREEELVSTIKKELGIETVCHFS